MILNFISISELNRTIDFLIGNQYQCIIIVGNNHWCIVNFLYSVKIAYLTKISILQRDHSWDSLSFQSSIIGHYIMSENMTSVSFTLFWIVLGMSADAAISCSGTFYVNINICYSTIEEKP